MIVTVVLSVAPFSKITVAETLATPSLAALTQPVPPQVAAAGTLLAADSDESRPPIPSDAVHLFRAKPATDDQRLVNTSKGRLRPGHVGASVHPAAEESRRLEDRHIAGRDLDRRRGPVPIQRRTCAVGVHVRGTAIRTCAAATSHVVVPIMVCTTASGAAEPRRNRKP